MVDPTDVIHNSFSRQPTESRHAGLEDTKVSCQA